MWRWDQGRLSYFNFDNIRNLSKAAIENDLKNISRGDLFDITDLDFRPNRANYKPWRNHSRIFKLLRLVNDDGSKAVASPVAKILAQDGAVTSDEYIHYIITTHTEPSPAFKAAQWTKNATIRWPLLFSLKYLLAVQQIEPDRVCELAEILVAYHTSKLKGNEDESEFAHFVSNEVRQTDTRAFAKDNKDLFRQGRESLLFMSQLSYLMMPTKGLISVNLSTAESMDVFSQLGACEVFLTSSRTEELARLAQLFADGTSYEFGYNEVHGHTVEDSGFNEGTKVERTHIVTERNTQLRNKFFERYPTANCDICQLDTHRTYPWTERVLDLHHVLPLSSGTRVDTKKGTIFDDLRPVCPSCHRAVHGYYCRFLRAEGRNDFSSPSEAINMYNEIKTNFAGLRLKL